MTKVSPIIRLTGITAAYPGRDPVLKGLDFELYPQDRIGLVAPNGTGKTTLFHVIMGLLQPAQGTVELFGQTVRTEKDFSRIRHKIGLLFQDADDQLFSPTVLEDVAFGPLNLGRSKEDALEISRKTLSYLGLEGFENRVTFHLSGGEKRLVSLATILAMEPKALLLDEPTTGLDEQTKEKLQILIPELNLPCVIISHEFQFLSETTERIYTMEDGKVLVDEQIYIHRHEHAHQHGKRPHRHI